MTPRTALRLVFVYAGLFILGLIAAGVLFAASKQLSANPESPSTYNSSSYSERAGCTGREIITGEEGDITRTICTTPDEIARAKQFASEENQRGFWNRDTYLIIGIVMSIGAFISRPYVVRTLDTHERQNSSV